MDVSKLIEPARKKIFIGKFTGDESDYLSIKLYPLKARLEIFNAQKQGINVDIVKNYITSTGQDLNSPEAKKEFEENPEIRNNLQLPDFDPFRTAYKIIVLKYGICKDNHSLSKNGQPIEINEEFILWLSDENPSLVDYLVEEIEKYQKEFVLGEAKKQKTES